MSAPSHLLYLLACANLDEPDAGWTIDGNGLVSASGDRISVTVRFHGYVEDNAVETDVVEAVRAGVRRENGEVKP